SHTSQRWTATPASASKPSLTFLPLISRTVTLSRGATPAATPTTTDSWLFLDKTNMREPPFSGCLNRPAPAPTVRRDVPGEQEHLDHGPGREHLQHRAGRRLDFHRRLAHLHARDPFDLLPQRFGGAVEQLPVKLLHLRGTGRAFGQGLLS